MEENNNNNEFKIELDKEELKNQTKDTVNQVKETIGNIDLKKDASATKGFTIQIFNKPLTTLNNVITGEKNHFSTAIILMICLMVLSGIEYIASVSTSDYLEFSITRCLTNIASPLLYVIAFAISIVLFGGKAKKNLTTILSALTISYFPRAITRIIGIVYEFIDIKVVGYINTITSNTISFISIALMFFAIRALITEENDNDKVFRKIAVIAGTAFIILKIFAILGIY